MIKEYWNLIGQEPFLALTWETDFSQACSFCRMLMNHKNFRCTQIRDKTNDLIFLKSPKTLFWGHFWPFLVIFAQRGFFHKSLVLSHTTIYGPLTPCWVSEKTNEPIQRKLMDRQKDRRKDRQILFYNTLPTQAGGPIGVRLMSYTCNKEIQLNVQAWTISW